VRFRWPQLLADLQAGRFDVAMSGVTVEPERSIAGRFSVPVAESGAVLLAAAGRFSSLGAIDRRDVRVGVNAGGHLEGVAREHFRLATLVVIAGNEAVRKALLGHEVDAAVSDTLEAPSWSEAADEPLDVFGPLSRDRKAYLVRADLGSRADDLDAWLLARERDGTLPRLRREQLGEQAPLAAAGPLGALVAALDERLALMPLVSAAKRAAVQPIAQPEREARVIAAGVAAARAAASRSGGPGPPDDAVQAFFRAQIDAAVEVQLASGRDTAYRPPAPLPDLDAALRPALLRIGERIAALLVALPPDVDPAAAERAAADGLRSPWLKEPSRRAIAEAIVRAARAPRAAPLSAR
jgi:cyclohexadienyl dehydratase